MSKKCPCCNQKFTFANYINQEFQKNSLEDGELNIVCKKCNNIILLANHNKKYGLFVAVLYFFIIVYLIMIKSLTINIVVGLFFIYFLIQYLEYIQLNLKCYSQEEIMQVKKNYQSDIVAIVLIVFLFFVAIFFGFYSFALDMKAKNHQKPKVEHIIKDNNETFRKHDKGIGVYHSLSKR